MSKTRRKLVQMMDDVRATYEANGRKDYDAGKYEGLKLALEILDNTEGQMDFLAEALNSGDGVYRP